MPFTCQDLLDEVEKFIPDILRTLDEFAEYHPWARDFIDKVLNFLRKPPYRILLSCHEYTVAIGRLNEVGSMIDAITTQVQLSDGKPAALIVFFGTTIELYDRYWFTRYEKEIDAYLRSVIVHEFMHAVLQYYGEYGEELPEKIEDALAEFSPAKFLSVRARLGWATEAIRLAYDAGRLKLFPTEMDFREWVLEIIPQLDFRIYKPPVEEKHEEESSPAKTVSLIEVKSDISELIEQGRFEEARLLDYVVSRAERGESLTPDIEEKIKRLKELKYEKADLLYSLFA